MIEEILQQSTTTATVTSTGVSPTDWISAISTIVMTLATVILARYAYVTIEEGRKDRRLQIIQKQLEQMYNPLFEFLDTIRLDGYGCARDHHRRMLLIVENHGAYLDSDEHDKIRKLLAEFKTDHVRGKELVHFVEGNVDDCHKAVAEKRAYLKKELQDLAQ